MKLFNLFALSSLLIISFGCSDERDSPHDAHSSSSEGLSKDQLELINIINQKTTSVTAEKSGTIDPENLNNVMDDFGLYFRDMLEFINQDEATSPSATAEEYTQKYTNYLDDNPFDYDFMDLVIEDYTFYGELADIVRTLNSEDPNLTIAQLKAFEDIVAETTLLTDLEKESLLAFSSLRKFAIATIEEQGITAMGEEITPEDLSWCFEDEFNIYVGDCLRVLNNYEEPFQMVASWVGLPVTVGACFGDGVIAGILNC